MTQRLKIAFFLTLFFANILVADNSEWKCDKSCQTASDKQSQDSASNNEKGSNKKRKHRRRSRRNKRNKQQ